MHTVYARRLLIGTLLGAWWLSPMATIADGLPEDSGIHSDVVFTDYSPLSSSIELLRRVQTPLNTRHFQQQLKTTGQALREQSIDLARETFTIYVPKGTPSQAYGLLVFVFPWQEADLPQGWASTLDRHHMILVSANNSGNDETVLDRRMPLALLAAANVMRRYPVDPERIYAGGLSGGSRVALRLAVAYPDLFRGALLDAGADAIGSAELPLPATDLVHRFQESTRLVYVSGERDQFATEDEQASRQSAIDWCAFDVDHQILQRVAHVLLSATALNRALDALLMHTPPDAARLGACRAGIEQSMNEQLKQAEDLLAGGHADAATKLLLKIDARYGGLAAPHSLELMQKLDPPQADPAR